MSSPHAAATLSLHGPLFWGRATLGTVLAIALSIAAWAGGANWLIIDAPVPSDVVLVLGGDDNDSRYNHAMQLLQQGMAEVMIVDADASLSTLGKTSAERAADFVAKSAGGLAARIIVCPTFAQSTLEETDDAGRCLSRLRTRRVLLITSDYHTRRALTTFRKRLPQFQFSAAAVPDEAGGWLRDTDSTFCILGEWQRLLWWEVVDQWRRRRA